MNAANLTIGSITHRYTSTGRVSGFQVEIRHGGLNEHKVLFDRDPNILQHKLAVQLTRWEAKWARTSSVEARRKQVADGKTEAEQATRDAQEALAEARGILARTLTVNDQVDWEALKDKSPYAQPPRSTSGIEYAASGKPLRVVTVPLANQPVTTDFAPRFGIANFILPWTRSAVVAKAEADYEKALAEWNVAADKHSARIARLTETLATEVAGFAKAEAEHGQRQSMMNQEVDTRREQWTREGAANPEVLEDYVDLVLSSSSYPDWIDTSYEVEFNPASRILTIDYSLPAPDTIPTLQEVTYVASKDELKERHLSTRDKDALFDSIAYQIALRTVHEVFESDTISAVQAVVFNGWVEATSGSTGLSETACILTVQIPRAEFLAIKLSDVDPQACFKRFKGISAARLSGLSAVRPIMGISRSDRRFVAGREVAAHLDEGVNLASMPWEDFEHLVRELFEQEFVTTGGEVHVTQASRDGGVDAVIFDPDPLRGGKIVVQAKRYTNIVDVSAVRDLYGTVMNEGANKGILVTTSDYGADSYTFAQGKPLTLLSGSHLLSLLEKHGHRARINLQEARAERIEVGRIQSERGERR